MSSAVSNAAAIAVFAACSLGHVIALPESPTCAIYGMGYNDPVHNKTPSAFLANSKHCQDLCKITVFCEKFTYYNNSRACWLQGNDTVSTITNPNATSGPVQCPGDPPRPTVLPPGSSSQPHALSAEELDIWNKVAAGNVTYVTDALEASAKELDLASVGLPDTVSTQVVAGTNYKFGFPDKKEITIFKSLTDELQVTKVDTLAVAKGVVANTTMTNATVALPESPSCAIYGKGYNDPARNSTPDSYPLDSKGCQDLCKATAYCEKFTFYNNSRGCWLQGNNHDSMITSPHVISGPARCPDDSWSQTHALSAKELDIWNEVVTGNVTYATDALEAEASKFNLTSLSVPGSVSTKDLGSEVGIDYLFGLSDKGTITALKSRTGDLQVTSVDYNPVVSTSEAVNTKEVVLDDEQQDSGGGFPWWILLVILLLLLCCAGLAYYLMYGDADNQKKKKKTADKQNVAPRTTREVEEGAPLMATAPAAATPVAASAPLQYAVAPPQYSYPQTASRELMIPSNQAYQAPVVPVASTPMPVYTAAPVSMQPAAPVVGHTTCPACGNVYAADSNFCRKCGARRA